MNKSQDGELHKVNQHIFAFLCRPDLLDTALMRPGRLDKLLYVGVAQKPEDKLKVLHALTRKFVLSPSVVLTQIANSCPETLTGADLYALCADAWMAGLRRLTASEVTPPPPPPPCSCSSPLLLIARDHDHQTAERNKIVRLFLLSIKIRHGGLAHSALHSDRFCQSRFDCPGSSAVIGTPAFVRLDIMCNVDWCPSSHPKSGRF